MSNSFASDVDELAAALEGLRFEKSTRESKNPLHPGLLIHEKYTLKVDRINKAGVIYWRCNENKDCPARFTTMALRVYLLPFRLQIVYLY